MNVLKELKHKPGHVMHSDGRVQTIKAAIKAGHPVVTLDMQAEAEEAAKAEAAERVRRSIDPASLSFAERVALKAERDREEAEAYRTSILGLPEAASRPRTAARIIRCHTAKSLPVDRAKAMLAALPEEAPPPIAAAHTPVDPTARRKIELAIMAAERTTDPRERDRVKALSYALRVAEDRSLGMNLDTALATAGVDPRTLQLAY